MRPLRKDPRKSRAAADAIGGPLVWTFDGAFATCLADMEDALRRAIVQVGDVASIAVDAGDAIQPAWGQFLERVSERYGLPAPPRVHPLLSDGPLVTLVIAYRS